MHVSVAGLTVKRKCWGAVQVSSEHSCCALPRLAVAVQLVHLAGLKACAMEVAVDVGGQGEESAEGGRDEPAAVVFVLSIGLHLVRLSLVEGGRRVSGVRMAVVCCWRVQNG